jgi:hypothetical protein
MHLAMSSSQIVGIHTLYINLTIRGNQVICTEQKICALSEVQIELSYKFQKILSFCLKNGIQVLPPRNIAADVFYII